VSNGLIALVVVVVLAACWALAVFNRLVRSRNQMNSAYARINLQLGLRHELIPQLVTTARGYLQHERQALQGVSLSRQRASDARRALADTFDRPVSAGAADGTQQAGPTRIELLEALDRAESGLNSALGKFAMVVDAYPELKADRALTQLNERLGFTETAIVVARHEFNDAVVRHNDCLRQFPGSLVANACGFTPAGLLRSPARAGERAPAMVHLP
jgi:LemA protein